jgi:hypothetical protein
MRANQSRIRKILGEREKSFVEAKHAIQMERQIAAEKKQAEVMQKAIKRQHERSCIDETLQLRELIEIEQTKHALQNELSLNRKFISNSVVRPRNASPLNLERELKQTVGDYHLVKMHYE